MSNTVKRRVIIRIDQFNKVRKQALKYNKDIGGSLYSLYDHAWCEPLLMKEIQQQWLLTVLKQPNLTHCDPVKYFLTHNKTFDSSYVGQVCRVPDNSTEDYVWVWPARCRNEKMLVWGIFEKTLGE